MTVLVREAYTYLVGLRPANLLSLPLFTPLIYLFVLVAVIQRAVDTLTFFNCGDPLPPFL